jgi:cytochrome c5
MLTSTDAPAVDLLALYAEVLAETTPEELAAQGAAIEAEWAARDADAAAAAAGYRIIKPVCHRCNGARRIIAYWRIEGGRCFECTAAR